MMIRIQYLGLLKTIVDCPEEKIAISNGAPVRDLIGSLSEKYGEDFRCAVCRADGNLRAFTQITVNGINIRDLNGLGTILKDEVEITVIVEIYPISGG